MNPNESIEIYTTKNVREFVTKKNKIKQLQKNGVHLKRKCTCNFIVITCRSTMSNARFLPGFLQINELNTSCTLPPCTTNFFYRSVYFMLCTTTSTGLKEWRLLYLFSLRSSMIMMMMIIPSSEHNLCKPIVSSVLI